uniref:Uncharacterized protein n=1 Tax=Salix viminalis TaxID=40686 RepID=A0A6N2NGG3_SALVM
MNKEAILHHRRAFPKPSKHGRLRCEVDRPCGLERFSYQKSPRKTIQDSLRSMDIGIVASPLHLKHNKTIFLDS